MTRVLLIHQAFASPDEPGGTRHFELARSAVEHGVEFTVVASGVSYLTGTQQAPSKGDTSENLEGVRVLRAYAHPSLHRSFVWRVISFLSFMFSSIRASLRAGPIDVVLGTTPPIFQAVSAWFVAALRRRPFVLEVRDLWPAFAIEMGVLTNPVLIRLSRALEMFLYRRAAMLIVNSPAYFDYLIGKGLPAEKVRVIPNGVDCSLFDPTAAGEKQRASLNGRGEFIVMYAGALGAANDIETILGAAALLRDEPIKIALVGDGKERRAHEALAREMSLPNVVFTGAVPKKEMPAFLAASDACIATLRNIPMFRTTYPNKVFDYMAAGRPTILGIDGVIREVVEKAGGGIFVQPGNEAALAEALKELSRDRQRAKEMGRKARAYVAEHFNRDRQALEFAELLRGVARRARRTFYQATGKRIFDVLAASIALLLLWPVLVVVALLVRSHLGSPVLFRQQRPGLGGRPFTLFKFRTMTDARDGAGVLLPDEQRLTAFGRLLRATSLDELPELINVLRGEMSLVGPRPLLMEYLGRYSDQQARRHEVKPGLTGWAQVNGRNTISWESRFKLDVWYVDHLGFEIDLKVICLTVIRLLRRDGISSEGHSTMPVFTGSRSNER